MKLLTKDNSKKANCDTEKDIEDIEDIVIKYIHSATTTDNCVNNSITDMANCATNFLGKNYGRSQDYGNNFQNFHIYYLCRLLSKIVQN